MEGDKAHEHVLTDRLLGDKARSMLVGEEEAEERDIQYNNTLGEYEILAYTKYYFVLFSYSQF